MTCCLCRQQFEPATGVLLCAQCRQRESALIREEVPPMSLVYRYSRRSYRDYAVIVRGRVIGHVFRLPRSGWYCDAGRAGFVHRTRAQATRTLLDLRLNYRSRGLEIHTA